MPELATHSQQPNTLAAHAAAQPVFPTNARLDELCRFLSPTPFVQENVTHTFTPGLYTRTAMAFAGDVVVSKIHKTEHPWVLLKGVARVRNDQGEWFRVEAPHFGVTKPGTQRVIVVEEDITWLTFHATEETDLDKIEALVIQPHDPGLPSGDGRAVAALQGAH
jgi:hypothetical protein